MPNPKSILFIDGTNLDHRLHDAFGRLDLDWMKLFSQLAEETQLARVEYCYAPYHRGDSRKGFSERQTATLNFFNTKKWLVSLSKGRHQEREVRCGRPSCSYVYNRYEEKGTDVAAASLLVRAACRRSADRLILVSNDNDYLPALKIAREEGAKVVLAHVLGPRDVARQRYHIDSLRKAASRYIEMNEEWMSTCWRNRSGAGQ